MGLGCTTSCSTVVAAVVQFQSLPMRNNIYVNVAYRMTNPNPCGTLRSTESKAWAEPISHSGPPKRPHPESQSVSQSVGYHLILASAKLPTCHKLPQLPHRALQLQLQLHSAPHVRLSCLLFWFTLALTLFIDDVSLSRYLSLFLSLSLSLSRRVSGPLLRHPSVRWVAARLSCFPSSPLTPASFFNLANLYTPRCTVVRSCCYYCILVVVRNWFIINMIITLNVERLLGYPGWSKWKHLDISL